MARKKIVFLIDTNPVVVSNYTVSPGEYCRKVNFAALSILNLFLRKHSDGDGNDPNPVWGFKFYDSYGKQFDYGKNHFYDLEIKDFEIFEEELTKRIVNGWTENRKISCPIAQQLTCALADIVSEFQWERPEFFSPIKSNTYIEKKFKQDFGDNNSSSNFVFLFTPCPSCCGKVKYFEKENLTSVPELQQALVKKELYEKMVHVNKIALYWLDTGVKSNRKVNDAFHSILSGAMKSFNGDLLAFGTLFSMWFTNGTNTTISTSSIFDQSVSFYSVMDALLFSSKQSSGNRKSSEASSIGRYSLLLSLKDFSFLTSDVSGSNFDMSPVIPLLITAANVNTIHSTHVSNKNKEEKRINWSFNHNQSLGADACQQMKNEKIYVRANDVNEANVKGIIKKKDYYSVLKNMQKSYYCSYDHDAEMQQGKESSMHLVYQKLTKLLFQKQLMLIIDLRHPENGNIIDACLHSLSEQSASITIMSPCDSFTKESCGLSVEEARGKLKKTKDIVRSEINSCVNEKDDDTVRTAKKPEDFPVGSHIKQSFMQYLDHWFCEVPRQSLSEQLHHRLKSLPNGNKLSDEKTEQKACQQASFLLSKLKELYNQKGNKNECITDESYEKKRVKIKSPQVKSTSTTYSQKVLAKFKAVKVKKKFNEARLQNEENDKMTNEVANQKSHSQSNQSEIGKQQEFDEDVTMNDKSLLNIEELSLYVNDEISSVLTKDQKCFEKYSNKVAKTIVLCQRKFNEGNTADEINKCGEYLDGIFHGLERTSDQKKESKVSRYILHALLYLDFAVILKSSSEHPENVADKVVNLLRKVLFLEDPNFLSKYIKNAILAKYKTEIPDIIINIYDGLALDPPNELFSPSKRKQDEEESPENSDIDSVVSSNVDSNLSSSQSSITGRKFRRFSSIGDSMMSKRQIVVPVKRNKQAKLKKKLSPDYQSSIGSNKEGWCRNLFDKSSNNSRKRKLERRHSEIVSSVKDTPVVKQRRHTIWKRQHGERRKSQAITDITVINESPLKEESFAQKAASRLLFNSVSFNCKTSPNRFYSFKRNNSFLNSAGQADRKLLRRTASCITASNKDEFADSSEELKTGLNNNFTSNEDLGVSLDDTKRKKSSLSRRQDAVSDERQELLDEVLETSCLPNKKHPWSNHDPQTFQTPRSEETKIDRMDENASNIIDFSPKKYAISFVPVSETLKATTRDEQKTKMVNPYAKKQQRIENFAVSEDSMDWVSLFERDNADLQKQTEVISLPCVDQSESNVNTSPDLVTPNRDEKQIFSSPFLSVSSLETLETAPILSPSLRKAKQVKKSSCRKRINVLSGEL